MAGARLEAALFSKREASQNNNESTAVLTGLSPSCRTPVRLLEFVNFSA